MKNQFLNLGKTLSKSEQRSVNGGDGGEGLDGGGPCGDNGVCSNECCASKPCQSGQSCATRFCGGNDGWRYCASV